MTIQENRVSRNSRVYFLNCCRNNQNMALCCFLETFHLCGRQLCSPHILLTCKATLVPSHVSRQHLLPNTYSEKRHSASPKALLCKVVTSETGVRSLSTTFTLKYSWITATTTIYTLAAASASLGHAQRTTSEVIFPQSKAKEERKGKDKSEEHSKMPERQVGWWK